MGRTLFIILTCSIMFASCSNEDLSYTHDSASHGTNGRISIEQAKNNAMEFVNNISSKTRGSNSSLEILNIEPAVINEEITRSTDDNKSITNDTLFYVINFKNNQGYVIASAYDCLPSVVAYIENGNMKRSEVDYYIGNNNVKPTDNPGYEAYMSTVLDIYLHDKGIYHKDPNIDLDWSGTGGGGSYNTDEFTIIKPLLTTQWDQGSYSQYCPGPYTGCVVTAVSQICSYLKFPTRLSQFSNEDPTHRTMDWERINYECAANNGNPYSNDLIDQISHLMRYWGLLFNANYSSGGTDVDSDNVISILRQRKYDVTPLYRYDGSEIINNLKAGNRIVYMRGNGRYYHVWFFKRIYVDGHAWVVDGYIHQKKNRKVSEYLHCNWGWGPYNHNGYFLRDVFNAEEDPYYDDEGQPTRSKNFRYQLEMAVFKRK